MSVVATAPVGAPTGPSKPPSGGALPSTVWLAAIHVACACFLVSYLVQLQLFDAHASHQLDVWFDTDGDTFLVDFLNLADFDERHPNASLVVGLPIHLVQHLLALIRVGDGSSMAVQLWLVLLVVPASGAVRSLAAFGALYRLTTNLRLTVLLCCLDIAAFEAVTIGSAMDSFAISGAFIACMYFLMMRDVSSSGPFRYWPWLVAGTAATAVTLTNLGPFAVLLAAALRQRQKRLWHLVRTISLACLIVMATNLLLALARVELSGGDFGRQLDFGSVYWTHAPSTQDAVEIAWSMSHTFLAPVPGREPTRAGPALNPDYDYQLSYSRPYQHGPGSWWRTLFTVAVIVLGVAGYLSLKEHRAMLLPALGIIAGNFGLHLVFGNHFFLYGLHWQFSLVWVIAGIALAPTRLRRVGIGLLVVFLVATVVNSWIVTSQLLELIGST